MRINSLESSKRGETIAETIIALTILAIGITFSGTIMAASLRNITTAKNRVIAVNIAREGIEATRNIRDTNWLKFSSSRRECWNHLPGTAPDFCDGSTPIGIGDYIIYKDENQRWRLRPREVMSDANGKVVFDNSRLYLMDIDPAQDTDGDGIKNNDADMANHLITPDNSVAGNGDDPLGRLNIKPMAFLRVVSIGYQTNEGVSVPATQDISHNRMTIMSSVFWIADGRELSVTLKTHLTDYFGREGLEG